MVAIYGSDISEEMKGIGVSGQMISYLSNENFDEMIPMLMLGVSGKSGAYAEMVV